jgi:hypothetical protein
MKRISEALKKIFPRVTQKTGIEDLLKPPEKMPSKL